MKYITVTHKLFILSLFFLFIVVGGYVFMYSHIGVLQERLLELRGELKMLETLALKKQTTETLLKSTEYERSEILKYFVSTEDPTDFLELIESSGRDAGVVLDVDSIKVEGSDSETIKRMEISLSVQGGWEEMYHFVFLLEHLPFASHITRATLTVAKNLENSLWKGIILLTCESI